MFNKRISIFTGHFGSGKTEVAVNFALKLKEQNIDTAIVDFDIVNPFFRTTDVKQELESKNIWVVSPLYANTNVDVPALPAEIYTLFEKKEYNVVFDVGGDDLGARALSRFKEEIEKDDYEMYFVINTRRPMTDTIEKIEHMILEIESASRLKVSKLVNNTNLVGKTTVEDVIEGHKMIKELSQKLNIPIAFASGFREIADEVKKRENAEVLYLNGLIKLPWN
ncbi:ATP synthase [Acetivibrio straminisolvens]|jgi:tRNA uridine 5-carbamoylmethylation protein Kti12|uniref:CobQ/CobB/MinD/ParA nucleotide binding domain-containing protein n=1 Tax=Acetivibrio straminisolvens JCM 21531 TaxID=1294263 RepID=W4VAK9_9FIRM|nr:ATP synthase [Acetivibrio straminisolvens]GAE90232.1 hypothetical protein JCM21531_3823 [Acetivibrio straminisolvens JCM 21531]